MARMTLVERARAVGMLQAGTSVRQGYIPARQDKTTEKLLTLNPGTDTAVYVNDITMITGSLEADGSEEEEREPITELRRNSGSKRHFSWKKIGFCAVVGVLAGVVVLPAAVAAAGFTAGGIAAGSLAAKMMSVAAIANGGGVAAGSLVATLQSAGALGFSATTTALVGGAVACTTACLTGIREVEPKPKDKSS